MKSMTILAQGPAGGGKSRLFYTAPGPRLLWDAEGRGQHLPGHKIKWDPRNPLPDVAEHNITTDTTVVIDVRSHADLENGKRILESGNHYFESVGLDSITEGQDRTVDEVRGSGRADLQDWGEIYDKLNDWVREVCDIRNHPTKPLQIVYVAAGTEMKDGLWRPYVRGQLAKKLPYKFDVVGYLQRKADLATGTRWRELTIDAAGTIYEAKTNIPALEQAWPDGRIVNPDLGQMLQVINAPEEAPAA
jgi:hypothetical protein